MENEITKFYSDKIIFDEGPHTYTYDGLLCTSVTTLLKDIVTPFDPLATATRMVNKNPSKYTIEGLLAEWKAKGDSASFRGTGIHRYIECMFNGIPYDHPYEIDSYELKAIHEFFKSFMESKLEPYATELRVGLKDALLCGTLDFVAKVKGQSIYAIVDWKSNQKNLHDSTFAKPMKYPFHHMDDRKITQYELQCSIYDVILEETFPWWNCAQTVVYQIHGNVKKILLTNRKPEARALINLRKQACKDQLSSN